MRCWCASAVFLAIVFISSVHSDAAVVNSRVSVTANDINRFDPAFVPAPLPAGPGIFDPVTITFDISYDPSLTYVDNTTNITLVSSNLVLGSALAFSFDPNASSFGQPIGALRVGGVFGADSLGTGADRVQFNPSTNDFWLYIGDFTTSPNVRQVGYSQTAAGTRNLFGTIFQAPGNTVSVNPIPDNGNGTGPGGAPGGAVPEPGSLALWGMGICGVVLARRIRQRSGGAR